MRKAGMREFAYLCCAASVAMMMVDNPKMNAPAPKGSQNKDPFASNTDFAGSRGLTKTVTRLPAG
jgi:hypothetical protein